MGDLFKLILYDLTAEEMRPVRKYVYRMYAAILVDVICLVILFINICSNISLQGTSGSNWVVSGVAILLLVPAFVIGLKSETEVKMFKRIMRK
jgi:hypothetical protein